MRETAFATLFVVAMTISTPASAGMIYNLIEPPGIPGDSAGLYGFSAGVDVVPTSVFTIAQRADVSTVPEPSSLALFRVAATCLIGIALYRREHPMNFLSR